jgi:TRAP-type C4-dicarboxylate transport system substrate-binding protein
MHVSLRLALVLVALLAAAPRASAAPTNTLRIAVLWPKGSKWMNDAQAGARELGRKTGGRVQVRFVEQPRLGEGAEACDGGMLAGPELAHYAPDSLVYMLPLLFGTLEEAAAVRAAVDPQLAGSLRGRGLVVLGVEDAGFGYVLSRTPVDTVNQFKQTRLWMPATEPEMVRMARAYGASPVPLEAGQVRSALASNTVDAVINSPVGAILLQWHTQVSYVADRPLLYLFVVTVLRQEALDRLAPGDRDLVREALGRLFADAFRQTRQKEAEALDVLARNGVERRPLGADDAARREWDAWAASVADRLVADGLLSSGIVATVRAKLSELRAAGAPHP